MNYIILLNTYGVRPVKKREDNWEEEEEDWDPEEY